MDSAVRGGGPYMSYVGSGCGVYCSTISVTVLHSKRPTKLAQGSVGPMHFGEAGLWVPGYGLWFGLRLGLLHEFLIRLDQ